MDAWLGTLRDFVETPSVTGAEGDYGDRLARELARLGFAVERQSVEAGRFNLLARTAVPPEVVFCTHLDTVPPFFGSREDAEFVHGRGSCDAKGPAVAMLMAAERLLHAREERIGFLFTVGEETDSAGAALANARLADPWRPRHVIVGEPTENRFVSAHKGVFKAKLVAHGVAGHSSQAVGPSAIHELVHVVERLLAERWGEHPLLGAGTLNIGEIQGGVAANVVADRAEATLLLRAVEAPEATRAKLERHLTPAVELECVWKNYGPTSFHVPPGETPIPVAFGTDAPHLARWGTPLLCGPGRILDAHTDHERIEKRALFQAAALYEKTVHGLLARDLARA